MKKGQQFWKDLSIVFSMIWLNLVLFAALMAGGAILLKISSAYPLAGWAGLLLNAFHMAILERVAQESSGLMPILLSFVIPLGTAIILGEGVLRVFSIYLQKREHREDWDIMVAKTFTNHIVVCGVGELGKALVKRIHADHPESRIVLVDLRPGLLAEAGLSGDNIVCIQSDMTSMETLKTANCLKARLVLLASGNDAFNLEAAYKIIQLNPQAEIWVRLHHSGLADLMDLSRKPNLHFFSPYQQAAEVIAGHLLQEEKGE
ncbi:MAG: NAD-binding protein [Chloroflexi bacterium]|nr:NAD-binding protein [Chloroflexota bacterium]